MRVILAEPNQRYDLSGAEQFGPLVYLSPRPLPVFNTGTVVDLFKRRLHDIAFNPTEDIVCLTGNSLIVAQLTAVIASECPVFKLLMFCATDSSYKVRVLDLTQQGASQHV